jgi:hypothetical protein
VVRVQPGALLTYRIAIAPEQEQFVDDAQDMGWSSRESQVLVGNQRQIQRQIHTAGRSHTTILASMHQPYNLSGCFSPHISRSCLC